MAIIVKSINTEGHHSIHCDLKFLLRMFPSGIRRVCTSRSSDKPENLAMVFIEVTTHRSEPESVNTELE
jgi:hypothetical protein